MTRTQHLRMLPPPSETVANRSGGISYPTATCPWPLIFPRGADHIIAQQSTAVLMGNRPDQTSSVRYNLWPNDPCSCSTSAVWTILLCRHAKLRQHLGQLTPPAELPLFGLELLLNALSDACNHILPSTFWLPWLV